MKIYSIILVLLLKHWEHISVTEEIADSLYCIVTIENIVSQYCKVTDENICSKYPSTVEKTVSVSALLVGRKFSFTEQGEGMGMCWGVIKHGGAIAPWWGSLSSAHYAQVVEHNLITGSVRGANWPAPKTPGTQKPNTIKMT